MAKPKLRDARVARIHEAIEKTETEPATLAGRKTKKNSGAGSASESRGIIVLGMHRAGTSAVTSVLANLGFEIPGEPVPEDQNNPRGYWEPREIVEVHDEFFRHIGRSWSDPRPLPESLFRDEGVVAIKERLSETLRRLVAPCERWIIKDPRMCRLMPLWWEALAAAKLSFRFLHVLRSPLAVAGSLEKRDRFSHEKSLLLWLRHNLEAETATRGHDRSWLRFEDLAAPPAADVLQTFRAATGSPRLARTRLQAAIGRVLDSSLVHHKYSIEETLERLAAHPWVAEAYRSLISLRNGEDRTGAAAVDGVRAAIRQADALLFGDPVHWEAELAGERFQWLKQSLDSQRREIATQRAEVNALRESLRAELESHEKIYQEIARHHRAVETQRQRLKELQDSLSGLIQNLVGDGEQQQDTAALLRLAESLHRKIDLLGASISRVERHEIAADEQRRGMLDSVGQRLGTLSESTGRVMERLAAADEQRRGISRSLTAIEAQCRHLDELHESATRLERRGIALDSQLSQLQTFRESLCGLVEGQQKRDAEQRQIATSLSALEALGRQLAALHESLGGQQQEFAAIGGKVTAIESLITERLENRHLALLSKSLEVTARLESEWLNVRKQLDETIADRDRARYERAVAAEERAVAAEERDAAAEERDAAAEERDAALQERDDAERERAVLLEARLAAIEERDSALRERTLATTARDEIAAAHQQALSDLAVAQRELNEVRSERDLAQSEITQLLQRASWKVTAPMRAILSFFKGRRQ